MLPIDVSPLRDSLFVAFASAKHLPSIKYHKYALKSLCKDSGSCLTYIIGLIAALSLWKLSLLHY